MAGLTGDAPNFAPQPGAPIYSLARVLSPTRVFICSLGTRLYGATAHITEYVVACDPQAFSASAADWFHIPVPTSARRQAALWLWAGYTRSSTTAIGSIARKAEAT
jgi:hypothetical protein